MVKFDIRPGRSGRHVAVSLISAAPVGGFLFGLLHGGDPDPNPIGRLAYACIMTVMTPWHAGFPPNPALGAGHSFNVWPYIAVAFLLMLGVLVYRDVRRASKPHDPKPPR